MAYSDPKDPRQKQAQRDWYLRNRETHKARTKANRIKQREVWRSFKQTLKCALCEENLSAALDFHHVVRDPSNKKVYKLVANGMYKQAIKEIREKCVVLCANHHRRGHHYERHGIPLDEPNYHQYEEWFSIKSTKTLDT
jgi:hypothetical protein